MFLFDVFKISVLKYIIKNNIKGGLILRRKMFLYF